MTTRVKWLSHSALIAVVATLAADPALAQASIEDSAVDHPYSETAEDLSLDEPQELGVADHRLVDGSFADNADRPTAIPAADTAQAPIAQASAAAISDVQITVTPAGLNVELISDQPLSAGTSRVVGNALVTEIPNATLTLIDAAAAEQFAPAEGIALVQVSNLPEGGVQVAITGTDAPPEVQVSSVANNLVLGVTPGMALASAESDSIQVVVTATRTEENVLDIPRSVTVITREDIEQRQVFGDGLADILGRLVPGFFAPSQTNETPVRGGLRGRPVVVLIDGVPQTPNNDRFANSFNRIDPAQIERIEVLRGPSAIYGDGGTGGVVNIITRIPEPGTVAYNLGVRGDTSLSSGEGDRFGYAVNFGVSAADERTDGLISLSYDDTQGQFDAGGGRIPSNGLNQTDRFNLLAKLGFNLDEQQRLAVSYNFYTFDDSEDYITDPNLPADAEFLRSIFFDTNYEQPPGGTSHVVDLTYTHADVLGSELSTQLYYRNSEVTGIFTDLRNQTITVPVFGTVPLLAILPTWPAIWQTSQVDTEFGGRLQIDTPLGESANLLWGADYSQSDTDSPLLEIDPTALDATGAVNVTNRSLESDPSYRLNSLGLFAQGSWDINDQWQISGGVRYENIDLSVEDAQLAFPIPPTLPPFIVNPPERQGGNTNFDDVAFNLGLLYRPIPEVGLFANFAQGFSIPNIGLTLAQVNSGFDFSNGLEIQPQKVDNYEIGVRADFEQVQGTLALFYNESDLGSSLTFNALANTVAVQRAPQRNYGVEATLDWQPSNDWRLGGLFSWNEGENDADNDGTFESLSLLEIQPVKIGMYVENDTAPGWTNRLDLLWIGTRSPSPVDIQGINPLNPSVGYVVVDFTSRIAVGPGELSVGIGNLFNEQYATIRQQIRGGDVFLPATGRTLSLRYTIDF